MREFRGTNPGAIRDPKTREHAIEAENQLRELSSAVLRLGQGRTPDASGSGQTGVTDHGALTGLGDDDHLQYALLAGRSGGQTLYGDSAGGFGLLTLYGNTGANPFYIEVDSVAGGPLLTTKQTTTVSAGAGIHIQCMGQTTLFGDVYYLWGYNNGAEKLNLGAFSSYMYPFTDTLSRYIFRTSLNATNTAEPAHSTFATNSASEVPLAVRAHSSQSADLMRFIDNANPAGTLMAINKNGNFVDDTFRICDNADATKLVAFEVSGVTGTKTLTVPNNSGTIALTSDISGVYQPLDSDLTTIAGLTVARGDILVGNSSPAWSNLAKGTASQALVMNGAATDVAWETLTNAHLANRTRTVFIPAVDFFDSTLGTPCAATTQQSGTYPAQYQWYALSGSVNVQLHAHFVMPQDYTSGATWKVWYANNATNVQTIVYNFYCKSATNGTSMTAANDISQTAIILTPSGTKDNLNVQTLSTTSTGLAAGSLCRIAFDRQPGHASDTNAGQMNFIGISLDYTADM